MPANNFRRVDLDLLLPSFRDSLFEVIAACNDRGCVYIATRGFDTYAAQNALYAQGRTKPGRVVTNAPGGYSAHNFGLAVDFVRDIDIKAGVQPSWATADYACLIEEAEKRGLHSGKLYHDVPHIALAGYVTGADLAPLREAWKGASTLEIGTLDTLKATWETVGL